MSKDLHTLDLTHTGIFSERVGGLFQSLLDCRGDIDIAMGLGLHPARQQICVMIKINDRFSTGFSAQEARAVAEIIESTHAEELPTRKLKEMMEHIATSCTELAAEIDELERGDVARKLN